MLTTDAAQKTLPQLKLRKMCKYRDRTLSQLCVKRKIYNCFWKSSRALTCPALANLIMALCKLRGTLQERVTDIVGGDLVGSGQYPRELGSIQWMQRPQHQLECSPGLSMYSLKDRCSWDWKQFKSIRKWVSKSYKLLESAVSIQITSAYIKLAVQAKQFKLKTSNFSSCTCTGNCEPWSYKDMLNPFTTNHD